jgi:hypothetical protein
VPGISLELIDDSKKEQSFNDYVINVHRSEINQVVQRFVDRQKKQLASKELLSNITLLQRHNDKSRTITKADRFVGFAITPRESKSININIKSIGIQGAATDSITLYLFDPTQETAIQTKSVSITTSVAWTDLGWDIEFDKLDGGAGSTYLIGYFESDLTTTLYEHDCGEGLAHASQRITRHYAGITPVRFNNSVLSGTDLPDMEYLESSMECQSPGFNLRINVKCDITDVLVDNITMFGEAVQYAVSIRYLRDALGAIGLNPTISSAQNREVFEQEITDMEGRLYGGVIEDVGYRRGIIDNLSLDFSELDIVCLKARDDRIAQVKF